MSTRHSQLGAEVAQQVLSYVRRNRLQPGARLTERGLAAEFGVSRSPVRAALQLLLERGLVRQAPQGGYVIGEVGTSLDAHQAEVPQSAVEQLYLQIVRQRFARQLPEELTEADLMRRLGASRAQLRNALTRLAGEGLVQRRRGFGWRFLPIIDTREADWESYEFRIAVEPAAIRSADFVVDVERLQHCRTVHQQLLDGMIEKLSGARFFEINTEFHEMLAEFAHNRYFLQAVQQQNKLRRAVEYESFVWSERMKQSCKEHLDIMDALLAGDREWAATLMVHHLKVSQRSSLPFRSSKSAVQGVPEDEAGGTDGSHRA